MTEDYLALKVVMMPRDANTLPPLSGSAADAPLLTIFGGIILSYIDQAGAIGAYHEVAKAGGPQPLLVTVAMNRVEFRQPVLVGDVVSFRTRLVRLGRTSITMQVTVESERRGSAKLLVTEAEVVYVGVDGSKDRRPTPLLPA
jgi:acyl-CoA thioesterase YciA